MKKILVILIILLLNSAFALDVVYPVKQKFNVNGKTVFFVGNVERGNSLEINSVPVKIWNNNFFVAALNLRDGDNTFLLTSGDESKVYNIFKPASRNTFLKSPNVSEYTPFPDGAIMYTKTVSNRTPVREKPSTAARRIVDLPPHTVLYALGKQNGFYKLLSYDKQEYWVNKTDLDIKNFSFTSRVSRASLNSCYIHSDSFYDYIELSLSFPVFYTVQSDKCSTKLTLHGVKADEAVKKIIKHQKVFKNLLLEENVLNLTFDIRENSPDWGYLAEYKGGKLIFKKTKTPRINPKLPLANLNIFIDPGHGGSAKGAVGPTRVNEKDINLDIAMKLASELSQKGANVKMSRINDTDVGLYKRVEMANENQSHIFVSIHANSLPDGLNPFEKHGTSVFYYHDTAKLLADIIKTNLVKDTGLKNDGTNFGNFAVIRTTMPVAVLVETAYMINPEEYILLQTPSFQQLLARSIANSIEAYALTTINYKKSRR